jgi:hypothetical protein
MEELFVLEAKQLIDMLISRKRLDDPLVERDIEEGG